MYNKIFTKILDSSIWLETHPTRIVWFTFLAAMDEQGFAVFASVANLAHRARVTLAEAEGAVKCLEGPDPNSSDPDNEGRRIERVHGGWVVLNSSKYRDLVTRAVAQEKTRLRVAKFRAKKASGNAPVTPANGSVTQSGSDALSGSSGSGAGELPLDEPPKPPVDVPYATIIAEFHDICTALPRVTKLTDLRKKAIRARFLDAEEPRLEWFKTLFRKAQASDLCRGEKTNWRASLDWLMNSSNAQKTIEGNYDNHGPKTDKRANDRRIGATNDAIADLNRAIAAGVVPGSGRPRTEPPPSG